MAAAAAFLCLCPPATARGRGADDALGEWRTPAAVHVQLRRCGEALCGRIVKVGDPTLKDANNPEPQLRARPVLGIQIFTSTRRAGANGWKGRFYAHEQGHTYDARLMPDLAGGLSVSVCGPLGFICSSETWTRAR